jgi:NAD(P)-dependent dehydrogenase (short-subunit alcohol dehydrogenase family)
VKTYITSRKEEELMAAEAELSAVGACVAIPSDLSTVEGVQAFSDAVMQHEPELHILVNNAGATWGATIDEFPEQGWDKVMDLNVKSLFFLTQAFLPALREAGSHEDPARVINIGSINGLSYSQLLNYSYSASKAAVHRLTSHMAADLAGDHINVNAIAPGFFPSKMTAHMLEEEEKMLADIPRGRLGSPEDAAGTAIYLSSRASAWVCGHTLALDGGYLALA